MLLNRNTDPYQPGRRAKPSEPRTFREPFPVNGTLEEKCAWMRRKNASLPYVAKTLRPWRPSPKLLKRRRAA